MSPTSEVLREFKDNQMMTPFKDPYENDDDYCIEDESMVIIKEE